MAGALKLRARHRAALRRSPSGRRNSAVPPGRQVPHDRFLAIREPTRIQALPGGFRPDKGSERQLGLGGTRHTETLGLTRCYTAKV